MNYPIRAGVTISLLSATLLFLLTALVGVWAAPDRLLALSYFASFYLGLSLLLTIAVVAYKKTELMFGFLGLISAFLAALFALHFLLSYNWVEALPPRWPLLQQVGLWIQNQRAGLPVFPGFQKNMVGTVLIILLPPGLSGMIWAWRSGHRLVGGGAGVALLIALFGLILTGSRGAWLGLGLAGGYTLYFGWRLGPGRHFSLRWMVDLLLSALTLTLVGSFLLLLKMPQYETIPALFLGDSTGRTVLWRDSLALIRDYAFTGSGPGSTTMVYSSYLFLLHVPYLNHAHNLYLQIILEQGLPGLIAFAAMVLFAIWGLTTVYRSGSQLTRLYSAATFAALLAMLWHGLVEAELFAHLLRPILFLPFGFTFILLLANSSQQLRAGSEADGRLADRLALVGSLAPILAIAALFLWPGAKAAFQANLGAVAQTRAELALYHWPEQPLQDELRRNNRVDLAPAIAHYTRALALDPMNVTAHRRLGQIALSQGQFQSAQQHLEAAYGTDPNQRATRQMLGEIYAVKGELDRAVQLWNTVDTSSGQLETRHWWYTYTGQVQQADRLKQAIGRLKPKP